jgi:transcriptional regulator with XRE-family HTH domain
MTDVRAIINQLAARRKQLGLTQTEIARRCHLTPNAISQLERRNEPQMVVLLDNESPWTPTIDAEVIGDAAE